MIDPRAVIDPSARIADGVSIGAFSVIGARVEIDEGTWIGPHVVINGPTRIGKHNRIFQFASVGDAPQDKKYAGEETWLEIGDNNLIREYVTINRGTAQDRGCTTIGNDNWIMAYCHIAHDCVIGNDTTFSNSTTLAGHVEVDDFAILGGFTLVHQFCKIGSHAFSSFGSHINRDVPPYTMVAGRMAKPVSVNSEGLKRHGWTADEITAAKRAYKALYRSGMKLSEARDVIAEMAGTEEKLQVLLAFIDRSERGLVR